MTKLAGGSRWSWSFLFCRVALVSVCCSGVLISRPAESAAQAARPSAEAAVAPRPNVVVITIDTLRADHLGCYGYTHVETPNIDALARAGVRFSRAYTPVP